ncbi:MAG: carboxypeptidase regulatory-like domain-containing protein [Candidatus Solibacter usitatus]|nr:carboxypeptidase regulatory-like domain-containing protein [Candidatus Solibacter usitatus]
MTRMLSLCLLALTLAALPASAQDTRGTVLGRVTDPSGGAIPGAQVKTTNIATGVALTVKTNESGNFTVPYLLPGIYTVSAETTGFKKSIRENVQVRVNDSVELNFALAVGDVTESIAVTAETPLLSTAEASLGQVVDERRVLELPIFSGNAMEFTLLAPGTVNGTDMRLRKAPFNNAPSQFSTDGSGVFNNEFNIDGITNTFSDSVNVRVAFSPPQSSIGEFKVQTSSFDAQSGHTMGSVVNINTKGGGNDFHGQLHWWVRHSDLDTPTIHQNRAAKPGQRVIAVYQDNRYGGSVGGPVILPRLYNGRNRTFWHFTYEANKFGDPNVGASTSTVPRANWRNGDFSDLLRLGANYQYYDPATIKATGTGAFSRDPIPGNILPASRLNPVGKAIFNLYPLPNQPGNADGGNNYFLAGKAIEDYWTTIGRIDHVFNEKNRMFVRAHRDFWEEDKNRSFGNSVNGIILNRINRAIAFDDVHMFSPTFLLNFRYGLTQQEFPERRVSQGFDLTSLGFSSTLAALIPAGQSAVPYTQIGHLTSLSSSESGDGLASSVVNTWVGNFTWVKGNHNLRFGPEVRLYRVFSDRHSNDNAPNLNFSDVWARGPLNTSPAPPVGAPMVAALLGIPGGSMSRSGSFAIQDTYYALYFQDDWKVSRKLTLNLGLRAEHESPVTERFNRSVTAFLASTANPISAAAIARYSASTRVPEVPLSAFKVNGGLSFANAGGNPREFWDGMGWTWLPRIGLAYQATPRIVLRAGYGVFYGSIGSFKSGALLNGFSQSTPIEASNDNGLTFKTTLANPLPNGLLAPSAPGSGMTTSLNSNITYYANQRVQPYSQRWSVGLQEEFPLGFMGEASYVGNRNTRLGATRNINGTPLSALSTSPTRDQTAISYLAQAFTSPFFGLDPLFTSSTISREQMLRPYPHFGAVSYADPVGYSWFHSLQARLEKRMTRGFTLQISYTWSKAMEATQFLNAADPMPYESLASIDRAHRIVGSGIWELPFGKGRHWGANMNRFAEFFAGGWQLAGVYQRQSGQPIEWGQMLITGDSSTLALPSSQRNTDRWFNTGIFNRNSAQQLASNVRTFPFRFSNVRFDSQRRLDFSLNKSFRLSETARIRFRADTFNVRNEPVLRGPATGPTASSFGAITAQEPPRSFQFSLQVIF